MFSWNVRLVRDIDVIDAAIFDALAETPSRLLDSVMPRLTNAADHSKLWLGIAGVLTATRSRRCKRAALRGVIAVGTSSLIANQIAKRVNHRVRPSLAMVPLRRRAHRMPVSTSFPSGHAASAAAFSAAVGLELPAIAGPLRVLAGMVAVSRVATGAHYPSDVVAGWLLGTGVAAVGAKLVPPAGPPPRQAHPPVVHLTPRPRGAGVVLVVNPRSHSGQGERVLRAVQARLPDIDVVRLEGRVDVAAIMRESAERAEVLGVAGGDGTVQAAAVAALAADVPLAVFPAGTFNHFAKDAGEFPLSRAIDAVRDGTAAKVDAAYVNDRLFLNTASIGDYTEFVQIRERYEQRLGKPVAALIAGLRTLVNDRPITIAMDDQEQQIDLLFLGNGSYQPRGFAPSFREVMNDGLVDLRTLDAAGWAATVKVLAALATGQLPRVREYHEVHAPSLHIEVVRGGPVRVARDGEVGEETDVLDVRVDRRALTVYRNDSTF